MEQNHTQRRAWSRNELLIAFKLYCEIPFGKMHSTNPIVIRYSKLIGRTSSALAMKLTNIASLDPMITLTGRKGLEGASAKDKAMWDEMQSSWESFSKELDTIEAVWGAVQIPIGATEPPGERNDYTGAERVITTTARVGQNFFRLAVLSSYNFRCCITGLNVPELLVASHIVPWRSDPTNRLNPRNGLCLSPIHDRAFDQGLITIDKEMTVRISKRLSKDRNEFLESCILRFEGMKISLPGKFSPDTHFLSFHRENIFEEEL